MIIQQLLYWITYSIATLSIVLIVLLFALFAIPFLGVFIASDIAETINCNLATVDTMPCLFYGIDVGSRLKWMSSFSVLLLTPLYFFIAFGKDLLVLAVLAALAAFTSTKLRLRG